MEFNELSKRGIGVAIEVHCELGPEILEPTAEQWMVHELQAEDGA